MNKARTLFIDIETFPNKVLAFGGMYEVNVFEMLEPGYVMCVAWKWQGEKEIHTMELPMYKGYRGGGALEEKLIKDIWHLLDEADYVIAQNGDRFDIPELNARFVKYGLTPPSPYIKIDTLKMSKSVARLPSHKLDQKGAYFGYGRKTPHTGKELWLDCDAADKKSWKLMLEYNVHDIELLEADYDLWSPWAKVPNVNLITEGVDCPRPGCGGKLMKRGKNGRNLTSTYQRYQCRKCGKWCRGHNESTTKITIRT